MNNERSHDESDFERDRSVMKMYMESAKSFITLSTGSLALTVAFSKQILATQGPIVTSGSLQFSWAMFLLAIGAGLLYQYYAVKWIEVRYAPGGASNTPWPSWLANSPGYVYGTMLISFYLGAVVFTVSALFQLN